MKRMPNDFKEGVVCPSVVVQRATPRKNVLCGDGLGYTRSSERPTAILAQLNGVRDRHHIKAAVDWCSVCMSLARSS